MKKLTIEQRDEELIRLASSIESWGNAIKNATQWNEPDIEELIEDTQNFINIFRAEVEDENALSENTGESKPIAGVTFSDGEFVPIENESIMQWIVEQPKQESKFCPDCGRGIETFSEMGVEFKMCPVCKWKPECGKWEK